MEDLLLAKYLISVTVPLKVTICPFLNFRFSGFWDKSSKLILESLLVRFVGTNDDDGEDDYDDDDVNDNDGDDEVVLPLIILSKEVSFELIEYCSTPESQST